MAAAALYYVFNGDADGLCALQQIRLTESRPAIYVTGVKRDTALLSRLVDVEASDITVLDIGLDPNIAALLRLLDQQNKIQWFDHHLCQELPTHPALRLHIDFHPQKNTALLVHQYASSRYPLWAVVGLFGDQMEVPARRLALQESLTGPEIEQLKDCGRLINYNSYGQSLADLHYHPLQLAEWIAPFSSPLEMLQSTDFIPSLKEAYLADLDQAFTCQPVFPNVYILPSAPWARRISGEFGNALARLHPEQPVSVLIGNEVDGYVVSVRSPKGSFASAAMLCREFSTGGGRYAAGGINHLPGALLENFVARFQQIYRHTA